MYVMDYIEYFEDANNYETCATNKCAKYQRCVPDVRCAGYDVSSVYIILLLRYCGTVVLAMWLLRYGGTVLGVTHPFTLWKRSSS